MLSYVQLKILANALKGNSLRYTDLKPEDIEQDLFNYHLRFLLEKRYLKKEDDLYTLTEFGKKYVIQIDTKGEYKSLFRVSVIAVSIRENENKTEIMMQKRLRHPYYGDTVMGVSGKVNQAEFIVDTAQRKLLEETSLTGKFKFLGVVRQIRKDSRDILIEDTLYHVCLTRNPEGQLAKSNDYGVNFWYDFDKDKILDLEKDNITFNPFDEKFIDIILNPPNELFYIEDLQVLKTI